LSAQLVGPFSSTPASGTGVVWGVVDEPHTARRRGVDWERATLLSRDTPDAPARLDIITDAVAGLRDIVAAEVSLPTALQRIAENAAQVIGDADAATITVLPGQRNPDTVACTDARYLDIDKQQYAADRGPCLEAARTHRPVRANVDQHRAQWPEFSAAAEQSHVQAYLSVPLLVQAHGGEPELVGSLNLYSHSAAAFDPFDEALMRLFSTAATQAISTAGRCQQLWDRIRHLETALTSRGQIDQAKGILMAQRRCSAEEAFAALVEQSQRRNVKLRQIAHELNASITRTPT
jgi:GAF domain-containing protein